MPIATKTFVAHAVLPASDLNRYVRDPFAQIDPSQQAQGDMLLVNATADGYAFLDVSALAGSLLRVTAAGTGLEAAT